MTAASGHPRPTVLGREIELGLIEAALDAVPERGTALVLRGEAGIGKSTLLDAARAAARARGLRVLSTAGAEAESGIPYASLHRLLRPLLGDADALPAPQRSMLLAAFGFADAPEGGDLFLVALGALGLLAAEAARQPLLVTVDDFHWVDSATRDVVTFVGRRVDADPIVLLGAVRDGHRSRMGPLGLTEHAVGGLGPEAAAALLDARAPGIAPALRRRLLGDAAGNPLALVELPTTAVSVDSGTPVLPISSRLEQAFADRVREVDPDTAALLLVFAADPTSPLAEVLAAGEILLGQPVTTATLQPAVDAALIRLEGGDLRFRHPLVRSAIYQSAPVDDRQAAHAALAAALVGQPDRRAQHRGEAATGPDEHVAGALEEMGARALKRGAVLQASAALTRAASLSTDPDARVRRLLAAAEPAFEAGRADLVQTLVEQARRESLSEYDSARAEWLSEIFHDGSGPAQGDAPRVLHLVELGLRAAADGERDLAQALVMAASLRAWWGGSEPQVRRRVVEAARRLDVSRTDARRVATIAMADPLGEADDVAALISEADASGTSDARSLQLLGMAGHAIGDYDASQRLFARASERLRDQGRLALLTQVQVMRSVEAVVLGDWALAGPAADEAAHLATETDQPIWLAGATGCRAALAGVHGDLETAGTLATQASATLEATGSNAVLGWLHVVRGLIGLSGGRYDEAYAELARTFEPGDPAYHVRDQYLGVSFLADAAVASGETDAARAIVERLTWLAATSSTVGVQIGLRYARPLLAADEDAEAEYLAALAAPWSARPFERARLQLAYGMWLRRQRRVVESRDPLRLARTGFDALGAPTWGERARHELRAAGERSEARPRQAWDDLSPQELQIAQLAAAGLSNRDIGQRLYLSPRTVASHLYRAFPKLGITSRAQLNGVLPAQRPGERP